MIKDKYPIERRYINKRQNVRPGTGNPGATADNHFDYFQKLVNRSVSAHTFIDDKKIL